MNTTRCMGVLTFALATGAWSQALDDSTSSRAALQAASELSELASKGMVDQLAEQVTQMVWPAFEAPLKQQGRISPMKLDTLKSQLVAIERRYLVDVMNVCPPIYAKHFTAGELRQLIAFYRSPLGQKSMRETPLILAESMPLIMAMLPKLQADIVDVFTKDLKRQGFEL